MSFVFCFLVVYIRYEVKLCGLAVLIRLHAVLLFFFFLMIRRPPRSTLDRSSAASDVYKRQRLVAVPVLVRRGVADNAGQECEVEQKGLYGGVYLSLIHISEPTRPY